MKFVFMILVAILYILFGVMLPIKILTANIKQNERQVERPIKYILFKILRIIGYFILFVIVMAALLSYYNTNVPSSTSDACTSLGGWVYSCLVDWKEVILSLLGMFITIVIHYLLCEIEIHNIFRNTTGKLRYVAVVFYLLLMVGFNISLIFILYGLFITTYYDSILMELFRTLVAFLPVSIFAISTYLRYLIKKLTNK